MPDVMRLGVLVVLYVVTAQVGLSLDAVHGFAATVWPPTGIALAALVLYGTCLWPGIVVGAFLVNWSAGAPLLVACGMALGNTLEALLGAVLLTRVVGLRPALDRLRDVLGLIVLTAGLSTLVSATVGVTSGWLGGIIPAAQYGKAWRTWWLGDIMGVLVVAPLLFVWSGRGGVALSRRRITEILVLLVAAGALSLAVFGNILDPTPINFPYLVFPPLIWAAVRLGPQGAATATALVLASAIWGTVQGFGPFATPTLHEGLFMLQAFMGVVAGTILVLAAVTAERRQAEAVAHEQRQQLHVTLSSIGDAVIVTDSRGRVTFLNPVAAALTGWPEAEGLGRDITEVFHIVNEHTRQAIENPVAKVMREGTVIGLANHTLLLARDGVERPIDESGAPMRAPQGRLLGVVLVFRDITERRRAEDTRRRLAAIVESSEDAIIGKTLEGIITSWNRGAERIYGYTAADVVGRSLALLVSPDRPDELPEILARLARGEAIARYETERLRQDGQVISVSLTVSPIRDALGSIVGASTIARDITAQRQAEAEVEHRRQEAELLAEIAQSLSASLDLDTVLQRVVSGAQELCRSERALIMLREPGSEVLVGRYETGTPYMAFTGLRVEPGKGLGGQVFLTGRPWRTDNYAADPRFSKEYVAGARAAGNLATIGVPILIGARVEGVLYVSNLATRSFTDRDEEILVRLAAHAAIAIQNAQLYQQAQAELAERQKAEAALTQAAAELEQRIEERSAALHHAMAERQRLEKAAQRAEHFALLGRLAAGVSHEIRNPLAAIFLHVDLLEEELRAPCPDNPGAVAETLREIRTNLARLDDLVQDYLTLTRTPSIQRQVQDLGAAVQTWGAEMQHEMGARGITILLQGLAALGPVAFHASTLRRALLNLVQNAADAMPQGGTVTLSGQSTATQVQLRVQDTGSGIPAEGLGKIFEPLYTTKPGGTGLGLYIVREIVAAHDGQITVESVEGQGTTFTLTLPRPPGGVSPSALASHSDGDTPA
jgi:PAS domain S-box-containing protein